MKELLIKQIQDRTKAIIFDCSAFIYLRHADNNPLEKYKDTIGGGNILSLIGLFLTFSFLSKVFYLLENGENKIRKKETATKIRENLRTKFPKLWKNIEPYFLVPNEKGYINETDTFINLVRKLPIEINLGLRELKDTDLRGIWNDFRNKLIHLIVPNGTSFTVTEINRPYQLELFLFKLFNNSNKYPSYFEDSRNNSKAFVVDLFIRDINKILDWLTDKIKSNDFNEKNIKITYEWIK